MVNHWPVRVPSIRGLAVLGVSVTLLSGCSIHEWATGSDAEPAADTSAITFAFGGDVHFEGETLQSVLGDDDSTIGPLAKSLASADVAVVNLESALTTSDDRADKELEDPSRRFWFKTRPAALDVLKRSGVDVATMANNHGADFGVTGVRDAVAAAEDRELPVIGIGLDDDAAYAPYETTVRGTSIAVHAGDASPLESEDPVWTAVDGSGPGLAAARGPGADRLVAAVGASADTHDIVVAYLHWGEEGSADPTGGQRDLARRLADAGADIVVGTHAHVPMGSGLLDDTYVNYGLGNLVWYHGRTPETGVLKVTVRDGEVVDDGWVPGRIPLDGGLPSKLTDDPGDAEAAIAGWRLLRSRTSLAAPPGELEPKSTDEPLPEFEATVEPIGAVVRDRMTSHDEGTCPLRWQDLRFLELSYVGFDGSSHRGELVVAAAVADDVIEVFRELYDARFPIQTMMLIDEFEGDDDRSMAANNTSGYNCRRVAGSDTWSSHAYGRAVDINPVQNPYIVDGVARPEASQPYVDVHRTEGTDGSRGVIVEGGVVTEAFASIGWQWGVIFPEPDYQHFAVPR